MKENKNIERLFQEKFKDFEVSPPDFVWENIQEKLNPEKKKRRVIPFWFKASGIAASFVALFSILYYNSDTNSTNFDSKGFENNSTTVSKTNEGINGNNSSERIENQNNSESNNLENNRNSTAFDSKNETVSNENNSEIGSSKNENTTNKNTVGKSKNNASKFNSTNWENQVTSTHSTSKRNSNANGFSSKRNGTVKSKNNRSNWDNDLVTTDSNGTKKFKGKTTKTNATISDELLINRSENVLTQNNKVQNQNNNQKSNNVFNSTSNVGVLNSDGISNNNVVATESKIDTNNNTLTTVEEPKEDSIVLATVTIEENPMEKLLREKEKKVATEKEDFSKWAVNSYISPVYFNSFSEGSPLSQEFASNDKTYNNTTSFGVGVSYKLNKKLSVKTGVGNLNLDYSTNNIVFYSSYDDQTSKSDANIKRNQNGRYLVLKNQLEKTVSLGENDLFIAGINEGNLNQQIQYIEVPMEMSYALLDKKFGIAINGGMSTLFLTKNSVSIDTDNGQMEIGKASNLSSVHFSSNIGLGLSYNFMKNFHAIIEPTLKYQINTFNENAGNFKPYVVGINTGISYKF